MGELNGLPGYPFAVIEHPIANNSDDILLGKAKIAMARIVPLLTSGRDG